MWLGVATVSAGGIALWWEASRPAQLPSVQAVSAYRIVYRVQNSGVDEQDTYEVLRPLDSRSMVLQGGTVLSASLDNRQGSWTWSTLSHRWVPVIKGLHRPAWDQHATDALDYGLRFGVARITGTSHVAGTSCTLVRTGNPMGMPMAPVSRASSVSVCVDHAGLVLSQIWWLDGRVVETEVATSVDLHPRLSPGDFRPEPVSAGKPQYLEFPISATHSGHQRVTLPQGFHLLGSEAQVDTLDTLGGAGETGPITTFQLYADPGGDLLEIDHLPEAPEASGQSVSLGHGRHGYLTLNFYMSELVIPADSLALWGDDPNLLIALASQLV